MATNEFLPFATAGGANALTPAAWAALASRLTGWTAGVAKSEELNTAWRQSASMAAMLGDFIVNRGGEDALDNGNIAILLAAFETAYRAQATNYVGTVGGTANAITITLGPAPAALADLLGVPLRIRTAAANTGAVTLAPNGLAATAVKGSDGLDLLAGELPASAIFEVAYNGSFFQIINRPVPAAQRAPSAFTMTTSAAQAIAASTITVVANFATGSNDTLDSTLAANQITIGTKDAGWWVVTGKLMYDFPASGTMETNIIIERNGNEVGAGNAYGSTAIRARPQASTVVKLAAGDVMRLQTTTTVSRSLTNGSSIFSGFKVGA